MKAFIAKMTFHINQTGNDSQFDIQYRVIFGENAEDAARRTKEIGQLEEETIIGENGQMINWQFMTFEMLDLEELNSGYQFDSQTIEVSDPNLYISFLETKQGKKQMAHL